MFHYFNINYSCNNHCIFCAADIDRHDLGSMSIEDFIKYLDENVRPGDTVTLNGGEPTIHSDFERFLAETNQRGAKIDLFTNGKRFSDPSLANILSKCAPIIVRIPLFGSTAAKHDHLTGVNGNFDMTINAIKNILNVRRTTRANIDLQIKLLLSKATAEDNNNIYEVVTDLFPHKDYFFSLNPLLISESVIDHKDTMIESCSASLAKSIPMLDRAVKEGRTVSLACIPICVLPERFRPDIGKITSFDTDDRWYYDPSVHEPLEYGKPNEHCNGCKYKKICSAFEKSYTDYFGFSEYVPIL